MAGLTPEQKQAVEAVAVDRWEPFIRTIEKAVPAADIVHDQDHVSRYPGKAVDQVRRQEHKELMAQGDETLNCGQQPSQIASQISGANRQNVSLAVAAGAGAKADKNPAMIGVSLVPALPDANCLEVDNGGSGGARTRNLCRDRAAL